MHITTQTAVHTERVFRVQNDADSYDDPVDINLFVKRHDYKNRGEYLGNRYIAAITGNTQVSASVRMWWVSTRKTFDGRRLKQTTEEILLHACIAGESSWWHLVYLPDNTCVDDDPAFAHCFATAMEEREEGDG